MIASPEWPELLTRLLHGDDLTVAEASWAMNELVSGDVDPAIIGGFLVALRSKGETVEELVGFRDAALANAVAVNLPSESLDIVGTGGDRFGTVNVSTMASFVCASLGIPVVKHGNRAASSKSGSSDVLSALGGVVTLSFEAQASQFAETGIAFINAALAHPGFRHAGPIRKALGIPTVFNAIGPLANPARPEANAIGVADERLVPLIVGVLRTRGASALVFRGDDGLDELSTTGYSKIWEVALGRVNEHDLHPRDVGLELAPIEALLGGTPEHNAAIAREVLGGARGPVRDIVLLNAAAGLTAFDLYRTPRSVDEPLRTRLRANIERAAESIDSGAALAKLDRWVAATVAIKE